MANELKFTKLIMDAVDYYTDEKLASFQCDKLFEFVRFLDGIRSDDVVITTGVVKHTAKPYVYFMLRKGNKILKHIQFNY